MWFSVMVNYYTIAAVPVLHGFLICLGSLVALRSGDEKRDCGDLIPAISKSCGTSLGERSGKEEAL